MRPQAPPRTASPALFEIAGLTKRLGGRDGFELWVPQLTIPQGAFVAMTGKSGSGKSTLLDLLSLIARPDEVDCFRFTPGEQTYDLRKPLRDAADDTLASLRRRFMGYVLQNGGLCSFLNIADNIALPMRMNGNSGDYIDTKINDGLGRFGMAAQRGRDVRTLSGGERQRVAILRALSHRPAVVFADEPTAALDFDTARQVLVALRDAAKASGTTIVMVTHDVDLIASFADQCISFERVSAGHDVNRVYMARTAATATARAV